MLDFSSTVLSQGPLDQLFQHDLLVGRRRVIVADSNLQELLDWSWTDQPPLWVPAGEASKSLEQTRRLYDQLAGLEVDRSTFLVAVGGGVVGDLAGFVAATYLRGLPLVQVPSTLVAQVDSSLGGKVGVDLPAGKNLVGAFYPARLIYLDCSLLQSLPGPQWNAGMAEVLKHALLDSADHFAFLEKLPQDLTPTLRQELVLRSRQVKLEVVARDPLEQNIRAHLNLGHTLAHAIESAQNYQGWNHGQAVGFGLRAALRLSRRKLGLDPSWEERLVQQLQRYQLPVQAPPIPLADLLPYLRRDKKNQGGRIRFVLLQAPGQAQICDQISSEDLHQLWEELQ